MYVVYREIANMIHKSHKSQSAFRYDSRSPKDSEDVTKKNDVLVFKLL